MLRSLALLGAFTVGLGAAGPSARAADPLPRARPDEVGMSAERLGRIDAAMRAEVEAGRMPGAVVAIARRGRLVHYQAYGYQDRAAGTPMPLDAIFAMASMTKPITGVAAMMLLEEGRLALGDPAAAYLPPLAAMRVAAPDQGAEGTATVPVAQPVTVQDLMRHTSGIPYGSNRSAAYRSFPPSSIGSGTGYSGADFVRRIGEATLVSQPGTTWEYGLSIDVLGRLVEEVSGQRLGAFMEERIFRPLGMADTGFTVPAEKAARLAQPLPQDPATGRPQTVPDLSKPLGFECGGGCGRTTAADYIRFAQMLLNRGTLEGRRILSPRAVEAMVTDRLPADARGSVGATDPTKAGYGFGLTVAVRRDARGTNLLGNPGDYSWSGSYGTHFWVDPKEELAVVLMTLTPGETRLRYRRLLNALAYQAIEE